ncbi:MAG: hypothetical protein QXU32_02395 [Nitrososphaerales archaeon]
MTIIKDYIVKQINPTSASVVEFAEDMSNKRLYPLQRVLLKLIFLEEMEGWEEDLLSFMIKGGRNAEIIMSPDIRERRDYCREEGREHFSEIVLVGGRRSSKGFLTGIIGAYKLYKVFQLADPGVYFNMDPDKVIDFLCIAASFDQAKTLQFADLRSVIVNNSVLSPNIGKDLEEILTIKHDSDSEKIARMRKLGIKVARDFAQLRVRPMAANEETIRGTASIFIIFDEFAHMMPGESRQAASRVYAAAEPSIAQFGKHALVMCNSSPYTKIGQFYEQFELAMRPKSLGWYPSRFAIQFPSWAFYDKWWVDPERRFRNAIMVSPDWGDVIELNEPASALDSDSKVKRSEEQLKEQANPDTYRVERRAQWAEVLDAYLDPVKVDECFSGILPDGSRCTASYDGTYRYSYIAHVDPSSTTAGFGFAIGHVEEFADPTGIFPDGIARHVVFDRVHRWNPEDFPGRTINYIKVREELTHIMQLYYPKEITFDQYNSVGLIQELREAAQRLNIWDIRIGEIKSTALENWNRWEAFKTALYLGLVHIPPDCIDPRTGFNYSEYAALELKFLREVKTGQTKRVEKQDIGPIQTKDIADCICVVVNKFLGSYIGDFMSKNFEIGIKMGAEGGYQIGGRFPGGPMENEKFHASRFDEFYSNRGNFNNPLITRRTIRR